MKWFVIIDTLQSFVTNYKYLPLNFISKKALLYWCEEMYLIQNFIQVSLIPSSKSTNTVNHDMLMRSKVLVSDHIAIARDMGNSKPEFYKAYSECVNSVVDENLFPALSFSRVAVCVCRPLADDAVITLD